MTSLMLLLFFMLKCNLKPYFVYKKEFNKCELEFVFRNCSSKCSGNSNLICGGSTTLSVYGPPPDQSHRFGVNGVYQSCKPWCKTGFTEKVSMLKFICNIFR